MFVKNMLMCILFKAHYLHLLMINNIFYMTGLMECTLVLVTMTIDIQEEETR